MSSSGESLRVLVVDDSALYRQLVRNVLREIPDIEVVGAAKSGEEALEMIGQFEPDLLTLDVRMPGLSGIDVLRELKQRKLRVKAIMLSSLTANGAQVTTDALFEGAFDFIHKPSGSDANSNRKILADSLTEKLNAFRSSHSARLAVRRRSSGGSATPAKASDSSVDQPIPASGSGIFKLSSTALAMPPAPPPATDDETDISEKPTTRYEAIVIGTSTGGPVALREVLPNFPGDLPVPILIVQHMPAQYTHSLAERLNESSQIEVVEGVDGMLVEAGFAYIAPGGRHMKVALRAGRPIIRITDDAPENSCRPAVDYLFRSAAETYNGKVVAVIMTGMGRDGTEGCRELKRRGAFVVTQHPDGCVVYGMPKAVMEERLSDRVVSLDRIAATVTRRIRRSRE